MCGRLNCYCAYSSYSQRLSSKLKGGQTAEWQKPELFQPSSNLAPTCYVPVLYRNKDNELIIRPMKWGIITSAWHMLHNVRSETIAAHKSYSWIFQDGGNCAILCDGFYEWNNKRPFFFYDSATQFDASIITPKWNEEDWLKNGPPMMVLAGIYSISTDEGSETFTCSVLTREATSSLREIHHRTPIVLENEEQIMTWLSASLDRNIEKSSTFLMGVKNENVGTYQVSPKVNNSKYQGTDCYHPLASTQGPLDRWMTKVANPVSSSKQEDGGKPTVDLKSSSSLQQDSNCRMAKRKSSSDENSPKKKSPKITDWFKRSPAKP
ncbi:Uncharacterised ACR, COG2135 [Nesidiocoris tenuis]|uniref:Abasic site processing protein HMCES n=1 Tax=Nesidiocoris tenuis TaxID=355587 RepID=A0ABN7AH01_9HEMI|nr:Uncharacterised ACR, COG2135 [Nesidiocoris tenuis]